MLSKESILLVANQTKVDYPRAFQHCHVENDPETNDYIILTCKKLNKLDETVGCNGKRATDELSHDALWNDGRIIDIVIGAGGSNPTIDYNDVTSASTVNGVVMGKFINPIPLQTHFNYFIPSDRPLIGMSAFWLMGSIFSGELERAKRNLDFFKKKFDGDYVRWFFTVGGKNFEGFDPWSEIGSFFNHPRHSAVFLECTDLLNSFGLKSHLVLMGTHEQGDTEEKENAIVDRACFLIKSSGHEFDFLLVEMRNEYLVNGGVSHNCRNMARRMRGQMRQGFPITLSSLDSVMGGSASVEVVVEEYNKLYGGDSGANNLTIHNTRPLPIWNPKSLRERLSIGNVNIWDSEPRGYGASGGTFTDISIYRTDLNNAIAGRAKGYCVHFRPGVWLGKCNSHWPGENTPANIYDVPNILEIAKIFNDSLPEEPVGALNPYPDENTYWKDFEQKVSELYTKHGKTVDPLALQVGRHFARTSYDLADKLSPEESKTKHLKEVDELLSQQKQ